MFVLNQNQAKQVDELSQSLYGVEGLILMENAGLKTADWIDEILNKDFITKIIVVSGIGNNGGDGFVIARHLYNKGYNVSVFIVGDKSKIINHSLKNLQIIESMNIPIITNNDYTFLQQYDFFVDGIFGIGLNKEVSGVYYDVIDFINNLNKPVLSIDIPSGLNCDTGKIMNIAIKANYTATYGYYKLCHFFNDEYCGIVNVFDVSFPKNIIYDLDSNPVKVLNFNEISNLLPKRINNSHKNTYGYVLIAGGSKGKSGAVSLSAKSCLKSGAGLVSVATEEEIRNLIHLYSPEIMTENIYDDIEVLLKNKSAVAIGPGLDKNEKTKELLKYLIQKTQIPLIIDADGLNLIANNGDKFFINNKHRKIIITPHIGEMARLTGASTAEIIDNKISYAQSYAQKYNLVVVLKGYHSVITDGINIYLNESGNNGLATAGSGDVLTGIIASFAGQNLSSLNAAVCGCFIHGLSGDIFAKNKSKTSLTAGDIIENLDNVFNQFENKS